jgi:general secretion pathway protein J
MGADNQLGPWEDEWKHSDRLPLLVEVTLRDADGRAWPPVIVALPLASGLQGMGF